MEKTLVPPKAILMAWRLLWDKLPTRADLHRKNVLQLEDEAKCPACGIEIESSSHFFNECSLAGNVWMDIYKWCNFMAVNHNCIGDHFLHNTCLFRGLGKEKFVVTLWISVV